MVKIESLQDLGERLNGLIVSIKNESLNESDYATFVSHKYTLIDLHCHIERSRLEPELKKPGKKLRFQKQYNVYRSIGLLLKKKPGECTAKEMYARLLECRDLVLKNI